MSNHSDQPEEQPKGVINWFIQNHVAANILMLLFVLGGVISIANMRTETFPSIDPRLINISVVYPGATPYEIADSITNRVEEELVGIEGVKRISSVASEGVGVTNVEILDFANADNVYNDVETAVNGLSDFPPENAERPVIKKARITPNVLTLALYGEASEKALKYWAEYIEDELRQLPGVSLTELRGVRDYQISIEISENKLRKYGLSLSDISTLVSEYSQDIPAGTIEANQGDILLRVQERRYTGPEYENIVLRTLPDGSALRLGDIANVIDGFEDVNLLSKFNGERAAFIDVKRSESDDTIFVADSVKNFISGVELPQGLSLSLQKDETVSLRERMSLMLRNGIIGFTLVFLILLLFLDLKLAFWTSAAIPISFLGGLMILYFLGYSLNMISLFALIVVLGIVVDDGIVTGESIFDVQQEYKNNPNAVYKGVVRIIAPVTIGVATTMAAFAPLIFSTGTLGQIIGIIPVVVIAILFVSLIEAYFILPAHLSNARKWSTGPLAEIRDRVAIGLQYFVEKILGPTITFLLGWRYVVLSVFLAITIMTAGLMKSGHVRFVFFPNVESDEVSVTATLPTGTSFAVTEKTVLEIEQHILNIKAELDAGKDQSMFRNITVSIGETAADSGPGGVESGSSGNNVGEVIVQLVPSDFRSISSAEFEALIRDRIQNMPNIEELEYKSSLVGEDADIEIELTHPDEEQLNLAAEELKREIQNISGAKEVSDTFQPGKMEYVFSLSPEGLAVGLTPSDLGRQLRAAYFGEEALRFQRGRSEIIVYVRYPKKERENIATLNNIRIRLDNGEEVPLKTVANIKRQRGYSQILTVNGKRIVSVTADADIALTTPGRLTAQLESEILPDLKSRYQGLGYSFEGESRDQREDLSSLGRNMLIALIIIYVLLGAQLRSYIQPFVIMAAIPFGVVGAILGHFFLGYDLTFISLFGVVALTGVVVNDSVVLIDYLNSHLRDGKALAQSAVIAVKRRFRPILLTTLSTCLGLLPMLLETSMQARFLIPMVVSLSMGILFATPVILILVPVLILVIDDVRKFSKRICMGMFSVIEK